ncbi:MAG: PKD domain-containing protein [Flavobacteriales bacterium]|nr:PKD domain-containing protein [Flavobacteriales bacterium]
MKFNLLNSCLLAPVLWLGSFHSANGQVTIELGDGILSNGPTGLPSAYSNTQPGSRFQLLFLQGELEAAGMSAGTISSLGFHVDVASGTTFSGYTIRMGVTTATALTTNWETGLTDVWGPTDFTDAAGWTEHVLTAPFFWDGSSNLVVEACYFNGSATGLNASVFQSTTAFTSAVQRTTPNATLCTAPGGTHIPFNQRPDIRFGWTAFDLAPAAGFTYNQLGCGTTVTFTDTSLNLPSGWAWDFGDGMISTDQDPVHVYSTSGTYTVTLISNNQNGQDTAYADVTIDLNWQAPIAACDAPSTGDVAGFGLLDVSLNGMSHPSADAVTEGYLDATCYATTVTEGTELTIALSADAAAAHAMRVWADWDGSGSFSANELVLTGEGSSASASLIVPAGSLLNTPLRLRAVAAYSLVTPNPAACGTIAYGQAEDYTIIVVPNLNPPIASFTASPLISCDGTVQFHDASLNVPTAWSWDFGDGTGSSDQDPVHTFTASGIYTITLTAINANGQDDTVSVDLVSVNLGSQPSAPQCAPQTTAYCCGYGIVGFSFAGISTNTEDGSAGYEDLSCGNTALVEEGQTYAWSVSHADATPHDTRIWIDLDNDGAFAANELIAVALDAASPSGFTAIPAGSVYDAPLRLRVQSDVIGQSTSACDAPLFGQVEDYAAIVSQNTAPPEAAFSATPTITCDGVVQFTDQSTNIPNSWVWDFGDGSSSTEQNPLHTYAALGTYTVTLTASNDFGGDMAIQNALIEFIPAWQCDTLQMTQANSNSTECVGILADSGGPNGPVQGGTSGSYTISPIGAEQVTLTFSQFQWGNNPNRFLAIYDGPTVGSPLIGTFTGNGLGQLPNNGVITSSGPSITLRQEQNGGGPPSNAAGFLLTWNCSLTGIDEQVEGISRVFPQPAHDWFITEFTAAESTTRVAELRDALGQAVLLKSIPAGAGMLRMETGDLPPGLYVLRITSGTRSSSRALIIR